MASKAPGEFLSNSIKVRDHRAGFSFRAQPSEKIKSLPVFQASVFPLATGLMHKSLLSFVPELGPCGCARKERLLLRITQEAIAGIREDEFGPTRQQIDGEKSQPPTHGR